MPCAARNPTISARSSSELFALVSLRLPTRSWFCLAAIPYESVSCATKPRASSRSRSTTRCSSHRDSRNPCSTLNHSSASGVSASAAILRIRNSFKSYIYRRSSCSTRAACWVDPPCCRARSFISPPSCLCRSTIARCMLASSSLKRWCSCAHLLVWEDDEASMGLRYVVRMTRDSPPEPIA